MCGIVAYCGNAQAADILVAGLQRLEYRGYDSAGVAIIQKSEDSGEAPTKRQKSAAPKASEGGAKIKICKQAGKVANLAKACENSDVKGTLGIAHTRWATHGPPTDRNSHPHVSCDGKIAVVHNGIVENFAALKKKLQDLGYKMQSDTDTELIAHLIYDVRKQTQSRLMVERRAICGPRVCQRGSGGRGREAPLGGWLGPGREREAPCSAPACSARHRPAPPSRVQEEGHAARGGGAAGADPGARRFRPRRGVLR